MRRLTESFSQPLEGRVLEPAINLNDGYDFYHLTTVTGGEGDRGLVRVDFVLSDIEQIPKDGTIRTAALMQVGAEELGDELDYELILGTHERVMVPYGSLSSTDTFAPPEDIATLLNAKGYKHNVAQRHSTLYDYQTREIGRANQIIDELRNPFSTSGRIVSSALAQILGGRRVATYVMGVESKSRR